MIYKCEVCGKMSDRQENCCGEIMTAVPEEINIEIIRITREKEKNE